MSLVSPGLFDRAGATAVALLLGGGLAAFSTPAWAYDFIQHKNAVPSIGGGEGNVSAADIEPIERLGDSLPPGLLFTDGHGAKVAVDSLLNQGKPVLLTLGYYRCPMLCNLVHEGLVKAVKEAGLVLGRDFQGLAVSIDPNEKPDMAIANEGRLMRALGHTNERDWPFLVDNSGVDAPMARTLARATGFRFKYDEKSKQFAHAAVAMVVAPDGKISRYLYGVDFKARDLRFAIVEASGGRVGTTLDRVLLACFKYDPMVQRYTPFVLAFVRIGAFLCFLALAALLAILWRKEIVMRKKSGAVAAAARTA